MFLLCPAIVGGGATQPPPCMSAPTQGQSWPVAKRIQEAAISDSAGEKIMVKVVKKRGPTILSQLQVFDPTPRRHCGIDDCFSCSSVNVGKCRLPNIVYRLRCESCHSNIQQDPPNPPGTAPGPSNPQSGGPHSPPQPPTHLCGVIWKGHVCQGEGAPYIPQQEEPPQCTVETQCTCSWWGRC